MENYAVSLTGGIGSACRSASGKPRPFGQIHSPTRNIRVTGGAGYIGSHTCKALDAAYDKAARILKWQPRFSDLDTIISTVLAWHATQACTFMGASEQEKAECQTQVLN